MKIQKTIWKARGNRHATVPGAKLKPRSIQYESVIPPVIRAPSIMTSLPLLCDRDVSDCQVGTVDVLPPFPRPVMMRPTMR